MQIISSFQGPCILYEGGCNQGELCVEKGAERRGRENEGGTNNTMARSSRHRESISSYSSLYTVGPSCKSSAGTGALFCRCASVALVNRKLHGGATLVACRPCSHGTKNGRATKAGLFFLFHASVCVCMRACARVLFIPDYFFFAATFFFSGRTQVI